MTAKQFVRSKRPEFIIRWKNIDGGPGTEKYELLDTVRGKPLLVAVVHTDEFFSRVHA